MCKLPTGSVKYCNIQLLMSLKIDKNKIKGISIVHCNLALLSTFTGGTMIIVPDNFCQLVHLIYLSK